MAQLEFEAWPSIGRLYRDCIISEKIDGTNSAIVIEELDSEEQPPDHLIWEIKDETETFDTYYGIAVQSRKRMITPQDDNYGFAKWVRDNAVDLWGLLGVGRHFGEWWGSGIQRGYGLPKGEKRFSLFNTPRWRGTDFSSVSGLGMVPELYVGEFSTSRVEMIKDDLLREGSVVSPGFMRPEGVVVYHTASRTAYKSTFDDCDHGEGGKSWKPQI